MKKALALLFATAVLLGITAAAQTTNEMVQVNVPFDFSVRGKILSAGSYTVSRLSDDRPEIRIIRDAGGHGVVTFTVGGAQPATGSSLLFHHYGDRYFLSDLVVSSGRYQLAPSSAERALVRQVMQEEVAVGGGR